MVDSPELYLNSNTNAWNNASVPNLGGANTGTTPGMPGIDFSFPQMPSFAGLPQKDEKVGFWEGLLSFGKGLVKPLVNIIKHPVKSALMIGGAALLIIGTGGAATPFLVAAGLAMGGFQLGKGAYNFFSKDTRAEKLAALEDMGEGTFTVAASVAGARSYAKGTSGGSAVTKNLDALGKDAGIGSKTGAIAKGLAKDSWTSIKDAPGAVKQTYGMVRSGEFTANIRTAYGSSRLAWKERSLESMREDYKSAKWKHRAHERSGGHDGKSLASEAKKLDKKGFKIRLSQRALEDLRRRYTCDKIVAENKIYNRYMRNIDADSTIPAFERFSNNGLVEVGSMQELYSHLNLFRNDPGINVAMGIGSMFDSDVDPQALAMAQAAGFDPMSVMGFDPLSMSGISPNAMGMDPASLAGLA